MSMRMVTLTFSCSHVGAGAEGRNGQDQEGFKGIWFRLEGYEYGYSV